MLFFVHTFVVSKKSKKLKPIKMASTTKGFDIKDMVIKLAVSVGAVVAGLVIYDQFVKKAVTATQEKKQ